MCLVALFSVSLYAHCGSCGVGGSSKKSSVSELSASQRQTADKVKIQYQEELQALNEAYSKDLLEIMSNDQLMIYVHEEVYTPKKGDSCCKSK